MKGSGSDPRFLPPRGKAAPFGKPREVNAVAGAENILFEGSLQTEDTIQAEGLELMGHRLGEDRISFLSGGASGQEVNVGACWRVGPMFGEEVRGVALKKEFFEKPLHIQLSPGRLGKAASDNSQVHGEGRRALA